MAKKKKESNSSTIAVNRKARYDYAIEDQFEAGIVLEGWEVKSLRDGRAQFFSPLASASTHVNPLPTRSRKLLLHKREISKLIGAVERDGYTIVPLSLYWQRGKAKVKIALAKGKKQYDKRQSIKQRDWDRQKQRLLKG
jgi:SsrA-binding protein